MDGNFKKLIVGDFQRKLFSLFIAIAIWIFVNNSITSTRVFARVPVRIVNLPADKTIRGLMPNGILDRRMTITLTGTKDVIDRLDSQDFEIVIDTSDKGDEWVVQVSKKNIVSLNPDVELIHNIAHLSHSEFVIHLSKLVTEKVPVFISPPKGEPPEGYQVLDIWPQKLSQVVSGPEEDVKILQQQGIEITFDLSAVSKDELDSLTDDQKNGADEVSFLVPESWKKVRIPFLNNSLQLLNSQESKQLRIDFLRKSILPLEIKLPVRIYYPTTLLDKVNPETLFLMEGGLLAVENGVMILSTPLYVHDVSRLFLDIVKDRIELVLVPKQTDKKTLFSWQVQFIEPDQLENMYILHMMPTQKNDHFILGNFPLPAPQLLNSLARQHQISREKYLRMRFREYMQSFLLLRAKDDPFELDIVVDQNQVHVFGREDIRSFNSK
ncbi:MAG: hypothetical protein QRY74_02955 [Chlamydia sp.]